jgi:hypothetical protein
MICAHCEDEIASFVTVQYANSDKVRVYCDLNCQMAHKREMLAPALNRMMNFEDSDAETLSTAVELVRRGHGHLSTLDVVVGKDESGKIVGVRRTTEKDMNANPSDTKEMEQSAQSIHDRLVYLKLEKKLDGLRKKTIQFLLQRNFQMYTLFKNKFFEEWVEHLRLAPNDGIAHEQGLKMKGFDHLLKASELCFFWKEGKDQELMQFVDTPTGIMKVVDLTQLY